VTGRNRDFGTKLLPLPLPPPAHDAPLPPARVTADGVRVHSGVPYAALAGARPLELDLYLPPDGDAPAPAVVFLHGGGWRLGSRHSAGPMFAGQDPTPFERVAQAGIAVAGVDYRLSGEATWPAQLHDAKAAVRWLRARATDVGIDPGRIAAWGESAGGHLAELLGLTGEDASLEGDLGVTGPSSAVSAVVAWYAPSDLVGFVADTGGDPTDTTTREAQFLGGTAVSRPAVAAEASPITHVRADAPPFLLLHGRADAFIPCVQSERLHAALLGAGVEVELDVYEEADHMWRGSPDAARLAMDRTVDVLRRRFGLRSR
jgi:acetyl esterase/lipase